MEIMPTVQSNLLLAIIVLIADGANIIHPVLFILHKRSIHTPFRAHQQTLIQPLVSILEIIRNALPKRVLTVHEVRVFLAVDQDEHKQKKQGHSPSNFNIKHSRIHAVLHVRYLLILTFLFRQTIFEQAITTAILYSILYLIRLIADLPTVITQCLRSLQSLLDLLEALVLLHRGNHQGDRDQNVQNGSNKEDLKCKSALAKGRTPTHIQYQIII